MGKQSASPKKKRSRIGYLEQPNEDTVILRAIWSPLPSWGFGISTGLIGGIIGAITVLVLGNNASMSTGIATGFTVGYFIGSLGWVILGVIGGDVLLVNFNLKTDTARVHQKLLWILKRNWSFNLEESDSIHVWARKGILFQRLAPTYHVALSRFDAPTLHLGKYPTLKEAEAIAHPLLRLLDVPIEEGPPTPPERD